MSTSDVKRQAYVQFEMRSETDAELKREVMFSLSSFEGMSRDCSLVWFSGLPQFVSALTYWKGKIYPVLDLPVLLGFSKSSDLKERVFLFTKNEKDEVAVAIAVPKGIQVVNEAGDNGAHVLSPSMMVQKFIPKKGELP